MTGFPYSILRFVPDPVREEAVNVGVVVAPANSSPVVRVLQPWDTSRLRALGFAGDIQFLGDVATDLVSLGPGAKGALQEASEAWGGSVRLASMRGALHADAKTLCDELFNRYVSDSLPPAPVHSAGAPRTRNAARRVARHSLEQLLPVEAVRPNPSIEGKVEPHKFDLGVQNGQLLHAVATLSFDIQTTRVLQGEIDRCAWAIRDVRDAQQSLPISLVTIGGAQRGLLNRARSICDSLNVEVVPEAQLGKWAKGVSARVRPHLRRDAVDGTLDV